MRIKLILGNFGKEDIAECPCPPSIPRQGEYILHNGAQIKIHHVIYDFDLNIIYIKAW